MRGLKSVLSMGAAAVALLSVSGAMAANDQRQDYVRCHLVMGPDGNVAEPFPVQDSSMLKAASFAPPCAGPHKQAIPAAIQAKGLAPEEPASLTVEVDAFCS